jgi:uncharacterized protein
MASYRFTGSLMHSRRDAIRHHFTYKVAMLLLDLDDLAALSKAMAGFGYNRPAPVAIYDADHLAAPAASSGGLRAMIDHKLAEAGLNLGEGSKVYMLTNPRMFGYCFNPLTTYYCCDAAGQMQAVLAEVNNTHGEQHPYLMHSATQVPPQRAEETALHMRRYRTDKAFYVSPFIPMQATYELSVTPVGAAHFANPAALDKLIVHLDEYWGGELHFQARLWGGLQPLRAGTLRGLILRYPLLTAKIFAAIHWEGWILMRKGAIYQHWRGWRERQQAAQSHTTNP